MGSHYFITGTDTDAGKTYVTCLLIEALRREGRSATGYKPFACGDRIDAARIREAGGGVVGLDEINPEHLKAPASPYTAALLEGRKLDLAAARRGFYALAAAFDSVLVEGAGGWEVPLAPGMTMADFARSLEIPVIVVVDNKLGALNHTLLTVRAIQSAGVECAGIILNYVREERDSASISNRAVLEAFTDVPVIAEVMHGETELSWPLA